MGYKPTSKKEIHKALADAYDFDELTDQIELIAKYYRIGCFDEAYPIEITDDLEEYLLTRFGYDHDDDPRERMAELLGVTGVTVIDDGRAAVICSGRRYKHTNAKNKEMYEQRHPDRGWNEVSWQNSERITILWWIELPVVFDVLDGQKTFVDAAAKIMAYIPAYDILADPTTIC